MAFRFTTGSPEGSSFSVPAGRYALRVIDAEETTSNSGNDMIKLTMRIIKPDGTEGPCTYDYLVMTPGSAWKIDTFLSACGQHPGEGEEINLDPRDMIGWECTADLNLEDFHGKKSNKVTTYLIPNEFD